MNLVGLDIVLPFLQTAAGIRTMRGHLVLGDIAALPFGPATFDGVWAAGTLQHLPKVAAVGALDQLRDVLKLGGTCYVSVERGAGEAFATPDSDVQAPRFFAYYEPDELAAALRTAGFAIVATMLGDAGPRSGGFVLVVARRTE
jgi:hypothetical protein